MLTITLCICVSFSAMIGSLVAHGYLHRGSVKVVAIERMVTSLVTQAPEIVSKLSALISNTLETVKAVKTISR